MLFCVKKNLLFALSPFSFITLSFQTSAFADEYLIDSNHTSIRFEVPHLVISTVTGTFRDFSGSFSYDNKSEKNIRIDAKAMVASLSTENKKRDIHLKSADFFDATKFPEITFKSKDIKKTGDKTYDISGDFTMHGITKTVVFHSTILGTMKAFGQDHIGIKAEAKINRQDFKMNFSSVVDAIPIVGNNVAILINMEGIKKHEK
jgi:polyisoprenoid-binding protein YceI